jgi:hypothetical protein
MLQPLIRKQLEASVLGCIIMENLICEVADVLTVRNFNSWGINEDYALIYQSITEMFPTMPIDLITLNGYMNQKHGGNYSFQLFELVAPIASTAHLLQYAFLLVQHDIEDQFKKLLSELNPNRQITKMAFNEIHQMLKDKADVFEVVNSSTDYLSSIGVTEEELEPIIEFQENVLRKIENIKKKSSYKAVFSQLIQMTHISALPQKEKDSLQNLISLFQRLLNSGRVSREQMDLINKLTNSN